MDMNLKNPMNKNFKKNVLIKLLPKNKKIMNKYPNVQQLRECQERHNLITF